MNTTYLKLKTELDIEGIVTRYKDSVAVAKYMPGSNGDYFEAELWQPIETEEETGEENRKTQARKGETGQNQEAGAPKRGNCTGARGKYPK